MAKFYTVPEAPEAELTAMQQANLWLVERGVETGVLGGAVLAVGAALLLYGLVRLGLFVARHVVGRGLEGEVVDAEPAEGGGFSPVIRYVDPQGKARRFIADIAVAKDPTGRRVALRVVGGRPEVVDPGASAGAAAMGALAPLVLGAVTVVTGLTGALAGVVPIPWP